MSKRVSHTKRTMDYCAARSIYACVVEKWIPNTSIRKDAFGFGDILAMDALHGAVLVQVCEDNGGGMSTHVRKIQVECVIEATAWLMRGNRIYVVGWGQRAATGREWVPRFMELVLDEQGDLDAYVRRGLQGADDAKESG